MSTELSVVGLGRMPYAEALELQRSLAAKRIARTLATDVLLLVEHPPVVTLGRGFQDAHLPVPREALAARGVELFEIERGGDVTYHGPGQLVGYPIFDLTEHRADLHWFLRALEQAVITALDHLHVPAGRRQGYTGVWTGGGSGTRKIASIGIHVKQWVTWHGFALNVSTDLSYFDLIVPCGIPDVVMTSVQRELGERAPRDLWARAIDAVILGFAETFGQRPQAAAIEQLERDDKGVTGDRVR
ncbi:MAG TPA: lipoyl(octanoyl) transferase LipB [Gemmatimonadales bacterium]|nr:lipoyl(octanoyl) transferase LipB [Gemmatimonadales bacterium]